MYFFQLNRKEKRIGFATVQKERAQHGNIPSRNIRKHIRKLNINYIHNLLNILNQFDNL